MMGICWRRSLVAGLILGGLAWGGPAVALGPDGVSAGDGLVLVQDIAPEEPPGDGNPFAGREVGSARAALDVLLDEMGLGAIVSYGSISEPDPEAVTLEGVVLADPEDPALRLAIGRIVISDLDLAGLATPAGPSRFRVALEAIDYAGLAQGVRSFALLPVPDLDAGATLTLAFSLLPAAMGDGRMTATMLGQLDRQFGLSFEVTASPPPGAEAVGSLTADDSLVDAFVFEFADWGFLGALMRAQAAEAGQDVAAFIAEGKAELRASLEPMPTGSPAAAVHDAVVAMLDDLDRPGVLRFSLASETARPLEALFAALAEAETLEADGLSFAITYRPME
jgi:hypothetical protein